MTDELLHEIKETLKGARLGYGSVSSQTYVKHVAALLKFQESAAVNQIPVYADPSNEEAVSE